jgi:peptide/nickel transport system substrate-binding protein
VQRSIFRVAVAAVAAGALAFSLAAPGTANSKFTINEQPVSKLKKGGTFVWTIASFPKNYNTSHIDGNAADTNNIMGAMLPGPFKVDYSGTLVVDKDYALDVKVTKSKPQTITYTLNPKAKWSDGKAITWKDYELYWKSQNGSNKDFKINSSTGYEDISSVKKGKTNYEVVVTFKKIYADWQGLFGGLLPPSVTRTPAAFDTLWKTAPTLSAGPFSFQSSDTNAQTVTIVPNKQWWGDKPVLDKIVYRTVIVAAQMDALANGELDFVDIAANVNFFKRAKTLKGIRVDVNSAPQYRHIDFSPKGVLADRRVRQAVMMAIDRNTITKAMIGVIDPKATPLGNHIFVKGVGGYKDVSGIYGSYNLQRADALLDAAGWVSQAAPNPRKKGDQELTLTFRIPSGVPTSAQEALLVQSMLQAIGVKVNLEIVPIADFLDELELCKGDMTVFTWVGGLFPISSSKSIYSLPVAGSDSGQNFCGIGSAAIDKLYEQANSELVFAKRADLANKAAALIWQEGHSLLLYQRPNVVASKNKIANFGAFGFGGVDYTKIGFTK